MFGFDGNQAAPQTRELLDGELRRILDEGARRARQTLEEHRSNLDGLVQALLAAETLDAEEAYRAAGIPHRHTDREIVLEETALRKPLVKDAVVASTTPRHRT